MPLQEISKERYEETIELYFMWKELNYGIKKVYSRGVNLPEAITEPICCFVNGFLLSLGEGSEDAVDPKTNMQVQIKATSNFNSDLTSFGPKSYFDLLHFVRLDIIDDVMYFYDIPLDDLYQIKMNVNETFADQQAQNRRPRFSIIRQYIRKENIQPYAKIDLRTREIKYCN